MSQRFEVLMTCKYALRKALQATEVSVTGVFTCNEFADAFGTQWADALRLQYEDKEEVEVSFEVRLLP